MDDTETLFAIEEEDLSSEVDEEIGNTSEKDNFKSHIKYVIDREKSLSLDRIYILHMCSNDSENRISVGLSNKTSVVFDFETLVQVACLEGHKDGITGIKAYPSEDNLVLTSSSDGTVKLWDLRLKKNLVKEYKDQRSEDEEKLKPVCSFDVSPHKPLIVAGTELVDGDAFLLFWDIRSTKLLGGYWETHEDDVTQVKFHFSNNDWIATGSTDGLLNILDISKNNEDDAFLYCLNTESSVEKIEWFTHSRTDALSCVTHTQDLQLWNIEDVAPFAAYYRGKLTEIIERKKADNCYVIDVHAAGNDELIVLAGSTFNRGECMKMLKAEEKLKVNAVFNGNRQIVRASYYEKKNNIVVTGGESGLITVWKPESALLENCNNSFKARTKCSRSIGKPY